MRSWKWISLLAIVFFLLVPVVPAPTRGTDGSGLELNLGIGRVRASLVFEENWREDLPYNPDRTLYPGDSFRLDLEVLEGDASRVAEAYRFTAEGKELSVNASNWVGIPKDTKPGEREVTVRAEPRPATLHLTLTFEEKYWYSSPLKVELVGENGETETLNVETVLSRYTDLCTGEIQKDLRHGRWRVICHMAEAKRDSRIENFFPPPELELNLNAGKRYEANGWYRRGQEGYWYSYDSDSSVTYLQPVEGKVSVKVVPYRPRFTYLSYIATARDEGVEDPWCYRKTAVVLLRYDGNAYNLENEERLTLQERAVLDRLCITGEWMVPEVAKGGEEQLRDSYRENGAHIFLEVETDENLVLQWGREEGEVLGEERCEVPGFRAPLVDLQGNQPKWPCIYWIRLIPERADPISFHVLALEDFAEAFNERARVVLRENRFTVTGKYVNPPPSADPCYRRDENYTIKRYERGDVKVYDNQEPRIREIHELLPKFVTFASPERRRTSFYLESKRGEELVPFMRMVMRGLRWASDEEDFDENHCREIERKIFYGNSRYAVFEFTPESWIHPLPLDPKIQPEYADVIRVFLDFPGTFSTSLVWEPVGSSQPVKVRCWRLREKAWWNGKEENVRELIQPENHPEAVMCENLWEEDTGTAILWLYPLASMRSVLENLPALASETPILPAMAEIGRENWEGGGTLENLGITKERRKEISEGARALLSDNWFLSHVVEDITSPSEPKFELRVSGGRLEGWEVYENGERKSIPSSGGTLILKRYGGTTFFLEVENYLGTVELPFSPFKEYTFNLNFSGGYAIGVKEDLPWRATLKPYYPPQAGELDSLKVYWIRGNSRIEIYSWPPVGGLASSFGRIMGFAAFSPPPELSIEKCEGMENIEVEFRNIFGATQVYRLTLSPYAPEERYAMIRVIFILLLAFLASFAWLQIWRKLRRPREL
jgi:hypothetical protein